MNYAKIYEADCANGVGLRTSLFVSGCTHHCKGCFNQETWDFEYGKPFTDDTIRYILSTLKEGIDGLSILGGEPFEPENLRELYRLIFRVSLVGGYSVWMYSGYTWEQLIARDDRVTTSVLRLIDVLVDGPFVEAEKDISLRFRGSRNQRIIDVQRSLGEKRVVLWKM